MYIYKVLLNIHYLKKKKKKKKIICSNISNIMKNLIIKIF